MSTILDLDLVKRLVKGSPLTAQEMDDNLCKLEDAWNALVDLLTSVIGEDGKLQDCSVQTDSLCDRIVTQAKRAWGSDFVAEDTGTANAITISFTPPITAYSTEALVAAKIKTNNTGPATLDIDGIGAANIKKNGSDDLEADDLVAGKIALFGYDGSEFQLLNPSKLQQGAIVSYTGTAASNLTDGIKNVDTFVHGLVDSAGDPVHPTGYDVYLVCQSDDLSFTTGDRIPISQVLANYVTDDEAPIRVFSNETSINVVTELNAGWTLIAEPLTSSPDGAGVVLDPAKWRVMVNAWYYSSSGVIPVSASSGSGSGGSGAVTGNVTKKATSLSIPAEGTTVTWSHGETTVPDMFQVRLVCVDTTSIPAELGNYSVGDEVPFVCNGVDAFTPVSTVQGPPCIEVDASEVRFTSPKDDDTTPNSSTIRIPGYHTGDSQRGAYINATPASLAPFFKVKISAIWVS
jgi:hypothetical protein